MSFPEADESHEEKAESEPSPGRPSPISHFPVVGVGASAGGLDAFTQLIQNLPPRPDLCLILVQHLDPRHESLLTEILSRATPLPVQEARDGVAVEPNAIYVIPPNTQLEIAAGRLMVRPREESHGLNMPIDHFLRSLAEDLGNRAVGVILSGGGTDGTLGLESIKAAGGITFAQTDGSARHVSMPRSAVASGSVDFTLTPEGIARELARIGRHPYITSPNLPQEIETTVSRSDENLSRLFALLRQRSGVDFTHYKRKTIVRRIQRQMALNEISDLGDFVRMIADSPEKTAVLFQDLLIRVTRFFRDPTVFEGLQKTAFPVLTRDRPVDAQIRVWVPGCSTGEEAYSIAMSLLEFLGDMAGSTSLKIIATDINDEVLAKARRGIYLENIATDVSPERLRRFFHKTEGGYRINKSIRDLCVFARHNMVFDPAFARIDLISCRNVLIYLDVALQRRTIPIFHYSLKPGGMLLLGPSETIGTFTDLFSVLDRDTGLYVRSLLPHRSPSQTFELVRNPARSEPATAHRELEEPVTLLEIQREADRVQLKQAPAGVLIDENLNVLQFRGDTSPYLQHAPGLASLDLNRLAPEGLISPLRETIQAARAQLLTARREGVPFLNNGRLQSVTIQVIPLRSGTSALRFFLVSFETEPRQESPAPAARVQPGDGSTETSDTPQSATEGDSGENLVQIRVQLDATRNQLQAVREESDATNEELQSANEEIMASNEELQSANEELQTTKEETLSANEELETVNEELHNRNRDLSRVNDDLLNLLTGIHIPIVMVNRDLQIRRFTTEAGTLFDLTTSDLGRPIRGLRAALNLGEMEAVVTRVIDSLSPTEFEIQDQGGHWHLMRIRAYETEENKIDGAVISVVSIDAMKRSEQQLRNSRDFVNCVLDTVSESLVVFNADLRIQTANRSFMHSFRLLPDEVRDRPLASLWGASSTSLKVQELLDSVRTGRLPLAELEIEHDFSPGDLRTIRLNVRPIAHNVLTGALFLLAIEDVTEQRLAEKIKHEGELKALHSQKLESLGILAGGIAHDLNNILTPILCYSEIVHSQQSPDSSAAAMLQLIEQHTRQAAELVRQILNYSGRGKFVIERIDLTQLVREMAGLLTSVMSKKADCHYELSALPVVVEGDATQIRQVLMNLITNASEALEDKTGTITIRTGTLPVEHGALQSPRLKQDLPAGDYAFLEVLDTGCGMTADTIARMFDPFYSTKFIGRGLGLAAVLGIIEGHRGAIQVRSETNSGSSVIVFFPTARSVDTSTAVVAATLPDNWRGSGTVLIIDDEEGIRSTAAFTLQESGYEVLTAGDGQAGLEVYREYHSKIVAVLLDLTMPRMGGLETVKLLRSISPNVRIILMSGYTAQEVSAEYASSGITDFVQKPYSRTTLRAAFRNAFPNSDAQAP